MASVEGDGAKSLLKFANPILVAYKPDSEKGEKRRCKTAKEVTVERTDTQEVLNCILPPREWEENGQTWREQISSEPATRTDVIRLGEQLDRRLQQQEAKETGICDVRRQLYDQAFNEVVRQVTVRCAERGLLLCRVRDELQLTLASLQSLYRSSVEFGVEKALMGEQGKLDLTEKINNIKSEKTKMMNELSTLKQSYDTVDVNANAQKAELERKHLQEMAALQRKNADLKMQLEAMIIPGKSKPAH